MWAVSTGTTTGASGKRTPTYATPVEIPRAQVQPVAGDALAHVNAMQMQGVHRTVYAYGDIEGIVRPELKGGDLLYFPIVPGGTVRTWLVAHVMESWVPDSAGWCNVIATLQEP